MEDTFTQAYTECLVQLKYFKSYICETFFFFPLGYLAASVLTCKYLTFVFFCSFASHARQQMTLFHQLNVPVMMKISLTVNPVQVSQVSRVFACFLISFAKNNAYIYFICV